MGEINRQADRARDPALRVAQRVSERHDPFAGDGPEVRPAQRELSGLDQSVHPDGARNPRYIWRNRRRAADHPDGEVDRENVRKIRMAVEVIAESRVALPRIERAHQRPPRQTGERRSRIAHEARDLARGDFRQSQGGPGGGFALAGEVAVALVREQRRDRQQQRGAHEEKARADRRYGPHPHAPFDRRFPGAHAAARGWLARTDTMISPSRPAVSPSDSGRTSSRGRARSNDSAVSKCRSASRRRPCDRRRLPSAK